MTRPVKGIVGGLLAAALAFAGLFAWAHLRAADALQRHEKKVAADIAALRARHAAVRDQMLSFEPARRAVDRILAPEDSPGRAALLDLCRSFGSHADYRTELERSIQGTFCPYEKGLLFSLYLDNPFSSAALRSDLGNGDELLAVLAVTQEATRGGGWNSMDRRLEAEDRLLSSWKNLLSTREFPAESLERVRRGLDHLEATRPTLDDALDADQIVRRVDWLQIIPRRGRWPAEGPPGGRSLFSWKIMIVQNLNRLQEAGPEASPSSTRRELVRREAQARHLWAMARIATALAWSQAERGALPDALSDLVPAYLSALPKCPTSGRDVKYEKGVVACQPECGLEAVWSVKRKGP